MLLARPPAHLMLSAKGRYAEPSDSYRAMSVLLSILVLNSDFIAPAITYVTPTLPAKERVVPLLGAQWMCKP